MSEHSPEPWEIEDEDSAPHIISATKGHVVDGEGRDERMLVDFRRVVACVNFLAGIDTVMLERFVMDHQRNPNGSPLRDCRRHIELWVSANPHIFGGDDVWKDLWKDGTPTP